ncbi:carbon starvation protein A [Escherichia coli]|uniref:Carbon starvation protein A n=1 Tax=Escherichia coli TaxID=562 RepID=A0A376W0F9_ECOLX|nr:carbon starvation protein A [Escherichia coli]
MDTHTDNNYEQIREIPRLDSALCNGSICSGYIALNRGEQINALWIVVASVCIYLIAYRFYGLYIAKNVLAVDPTRMTPAVRHNDGLDYVPTDKKVLFGHHFAAIAGAGPLVGPVWRRKWVTCQG